MGPASAQSTMTAARSAIGDMLLLTHHGEGHDVRPRRLSAPTRQPGLTRSRSPRRPPIHRRGTSGAPGAQLRATHLPGAYPRAAATAVGPMPDRVGGVEGSWLHLVMGGVVAGRGRGGVVVAVGVSGGGAGPRRRSGVVGGQLSAVRIARLRPAAPGGGRRRGMSYARGR